MAACLEVKAQTRSKLAGRILEEINNIGQDRIISVIMDEGGKLAGNTIFASSRAYIFYKN